MSDLRHLLRENKRHIILAVSLSCGIFAGLILAHVLGVGGIQVDPWLLATGLIIAEMGKTLACFGTKKNSWLMEYSGVFTQGLAWWVWSLNTQFLSGHSGYCWLFHVLTPAILLGSLTVASHFATKSLVNTPEQQPE